MEELRPWGVCCGGAARASCWQCVHGKTRLSALLLCHLAWAVWVMCNKQTAPSSCTLQLGCTATVCAEGSTPWASPDDDHQSPWWPPPLPQLRLLPGWAPCSLHLPLGWETLRWGWAAPVSPSALPALRRPWQALPDCGNRHNNSQESPLLWSQLMEFHPPATAFLEHLILHCQLVDSINYDKWDEVPESW